MTSIQDSSFTERYQHALATASLHTSCLLDPSIADEGISCEISHLLSIHTKSHYRFLVTKKKVQPSWTLRHTSSRTWESCLCLVLIVVLMCVCGVCMQVVCVCSGGGNMQKLVGGELKFSAPNINVSVLIIFTTFSLKRWGGTCPYSSTG